MGNTSHVYVVVVVYVWTVSKSLYIQCNEVKEEEDEKKLPVNQSLILLTFHLHSIYFLFNESGEYCYWANSRTQQHQTQIPNSVYTEIIVCVWVSERFLHVKRNFFDQKTARKPLYSMAYIAIAWALRHY